MKTIKLTVTALLVFLATNLLAIDYEWSETYNGGGADKGLHVTSDELGRQYLAGVSEFVGGSKLVTSTYSDDGILLSLNVANTFLSSSTVKKLDRDNALNMYVLCENSLTSFTLIKYNRNGIEKWRRSFNNAAVKFEIGNANAIFVSWITSAGATIRKINSGNGTTNWTRDIADAALLSQASLSDFKGDINDNVYFCGTTGTGPTSDDYRLVKIKKNGNIVYNIRFSSPGADDDELYKIAVNTSGELFVVGDYDNNIPTRTNFHMVKFNNHGVFQWATQFEYSGPTSSFYPQSVKVGPDGNVVCMGTDNDYYNINPAGEVRRIKISKFDSSTGAIIFSTFPHDPSGTFDNLRENGVCMSIGGDNSIYFGGSSNVYAGITVAPDRWMISKVSSTGTPQWVDATTSFNDPSNVINDIYVTSGNDVYLAATETFGVTTEMEIIKYCQVDCFVLRQYQSDSNAFEANVYPNPSSTGFNLASTLTTGETINMIVTDMNGKIIETRLISENTYQFGSEYSAGIYFIQLKNARIEKTLKVIKTE